MKVLFINGSPHPKGCTWRALVEVSRALNEEGIQVEWIPMGGQPVRGCMGCGACKESGLKRCIYGDDAVNVAITRMEQCDGLIVGSPVHYGGASGACTSFLDRMFYASGGFAGKPGAAGDCSAFHDECALDIYAAAAVLISVKAAGNKPCPACTAVPQRQAAIDTEHIAV